MPAAEYPADGTTILDALFPPGVAVALSLSAGHTTELWAGELASAASFAPARLVEFRHGRTCARRALARLGHAPADIPAGTSREPLWPPGIVGSISHAGEAAAAVVARASDFLALGLDLEIASALDPELVSSICRVEEVDRILTEARDVGYRAKMVFSMKEATYKALWPSLRLFLDFHDIEIRLSAQGSRFAVTSRSDRCPAELAARIEGRCVLSGDFYAAGAAIRA